MPVHPSDTQTLAGYRLIRKLGEGTRSEAFLGIALSTTTDQSADEESQRTAVLKVFRSGTDRHEIGTELAALAAAELRHCVQLLDVATASDGQPAAVLARVRRGSVAGLLRDRDSIEPGEAVTLIAPIAATMTALHRRGVAHSNLGVWAVHLGAGGEPVILGFGHSVVFEAGLSAAALDREAAAVADRDGLAGFAAGVLAHVRGANDDPAVRSLRTWIEDSHGNRQFEFAGELEDRLFDLADPRPIGFAQISGVAAAVPSRAGLPAHGGDAPKSKDPADSRRGRRSPRPSGSHAAESRGGAVFEILAGLVLTNPAAALKDRALAAIRGVRKPLWLIAGAVGIALVLALLLLPSSNHQRAVATETPMPTPHSDSTVIAVPVTDDPLLAVTALLDKRNECIRERSITCLGFADEQSSQALADDTALVQRAQRGDELPSSAAIVTSGPQLIERLGDSALIVLNPKSDPASALLIRGKTGWRIRSFDTGKPIQP